MVHHACSSISKADVLNYLGKGDLHTHTYNPHASSVLGADGRLLPAVREARERGVLFDVGHGMGSFGWRVAESCIRQGFEPDIISTDLHAENVRGPVYDLATVMTKFLNLGMTVNNIIKAVTWTPAQSIGLSELLGCLSEGRQADITILKLEDCNVELEDSLGEVRRITRRFKPVKVFLGGIGYPIVENDGQWPNPLSVVRLKEAIKKMNLPKGEGDDQLV